LSLPRIRESQRQLSMALGIVFAQRQRLLKGPDRQVGEESGFRVLVYTQRV
jgi:hypothetical protein